MFHYLRQPTSVRKVMADNKDAVAVYNETIIVMMRIVMADNSGNNNNNTDATFWNFLVVHTLTGKPNSMHDIEEGEEDSQYFSVTYVVFVSEHLCSAFYENASKLVTIGNRYSNFNPGVWQLLINYLLSYLRSQLLTRIMVWIWNIGNNDYTLIRVMHLFWDVWTRYPPSLMSLHTPIKPNQQVPIQDGQIVL